MTLKALSVDKRLSSALGKANNAYTYISVVYNISISVALYSLVIFWQSRSSTRTSYLQDALSLSNSCSL